MAIFYTIGEQKIRSGVYQRYENVGNPLLAGASDGTVAYILKSDFGALDTVHTLESLAEARRAFGREPEGIRDIFNAGARTIHAVRVGNEGTKAKAELVDTAETHVVTIEAKSEGTLSIKTEVRTVLGTDGSAAKEFAVYIDNMLIERWPIAGDTEADGLIEAAKNSAYITATKAEGYTGAGALKPSEYTLAGGAEPTTDVGAYTKAMELLEPVRFNAIATDSEDKDVNDVLAAFAQRAFLEGNMFFAVVGQPTSVEFSERMTNAKAYNAKNVVYVGGAYLQGARRMDGAAAVATVAAHIARTSAAQSITHQPVAGATGLAERLTNSQYEQATKAGMLTFSASSTGTVWIESGITTLNTLSDNDDEGWKKIKRGKVRMEMMQRISDSTENLAGNVPNNPDGQSAIIQAAQGVLNNMMGEGKLAPNAIIEIDPANPPVGDSAWFRIDAYDYDSLEKIYLAYEFRFAQTA